MLLKTKKLAFTFLVILCFQVLLPLSQEVMFGRNIQGESMIEEVTKYFYRVEIPLPGNPLKSINSYILKGRGRNLIIDTGMNQEECMEQFLG